MTDKVAETAAFYCRYFGYAAVFESDWYVSLRHASAPQFELAVLQPQHDSVPQGHRANVQGLLINIEVEDARAEHARLIEEHGLPLARPLRDDSWGQRHFITLDPAGTLIDVIENLPGTPSDV